MGGRGASIKINSRLKSFSMSIKIPVLVEKSKTISQENISNRKSRNKYFREEKFRKIAEIPKIIGNRYFLNEKIKISHFVMQPDSTKQHVLSSHPNISEKLFKKYKTKIIENPDKVYINLKDKSLVFGKSIKGKDYSVIVKPTGSKNKPSIKTYMATMYDVDGDFHSRYETDKSSKIFRKIFG